MAGVVADKRQAHRLARPRRLQGRRANSCWNCESGEEAERYRGRRVHRRRQEWRPAAEHRHARWRPRKRPPRRYGGNEPRAGVEDDVAFSGFCAGMHDVFAPGWGGCFSARPSVRRIVFGVRIVVCMLEHHDVVGACRDRGPGHDLHGGALGEFHAGYSMASPARIWPVTESGSPDGVPRRSRRNRRESSGRRAADRGRRALAGQGRGPAHRRPRDFWFAG